MVATRSNIRCAHPGASENDHWFSVHRIEILTKSEQLRPKSPNLAEAGPHLAQNSAKHSEHRGRNKPNSVEIAHVRQNSAQNGADRADVARARLNLAASGQCLTDIGLTSVDVAQICCVRTKFGRSRATLGRDHPNWAASGKSSPKSDQTWSKSPRTTVVQIGPCWGSGQISWDRAS